MDAAMELVSYVTLHTPDPLVLELHFRILNLYTSGDTVTSLELLGKASSR